MRATDDGVKAAATDTMWKMTGIKGQYDPIQNKYQPPKPYYPWEEVVKENNLRLIIEDNLCVYPEFSPLVLVQIRQETCKYWE